MGVNKLADLIEKKRKAQKLDAVEEKAAKSHKDAIASSPAQTQTPKDAPSNDQKEAALLLVPQEVKRRLRLLGQPITLFAESESERALRLLKAQKEVKYNADDDRGDSQVFNAVRLERERREEQENARKEKLKALQPDGAEPKSNSASASHQADPASPDDPLMADFAKAAQELRERLEEQNMEIEDKVLKYLQKYCDIWGRDLDARSEVDKDSGPGRQATLQYSQVVSYFKPLYQQLKDRTCPPEMVAGLWMYIQDVQSRNYLHATDIYMHLAVGNNPWPIGVTSIGIHDRSAREKIGHTMNAAHIMNDEATRKYLQGLKRLLTFMQRMFPTDPSRAVDFDGFKDAGRGFAGSGSDKLALINAEKKGDMKLLPAPHKLDTDGSVKVPEKWSNMIRKSEAFKGYQKPPKTPPRAAANN